MQWTTSSVDRSMQWTAHSVDDGVTLMICWCGFWYVVVLDQICCGTRWSSSVDSHWEHSQILRAEAGTSSSTSSQSEKNRTSFSRETSSCNVDCSKVMFYLLLTFLFVLMFGRCLQEHEVIDMLMYCETWIRCRCCLFVHTADSFTNFRP